MTLSATPDQIIAEECVIASIFYDNDQLFEVDLRPDEIYTPRNQLLFAVMSDLIAAGEVADLVTVATQLRGQVQAAEISLIFDRIPVSTNIRRHAEIVREGARRRSLHQRATQATQACTENGNIDDIVALMQDTHDDLTPRQDTSLAAITTQCIERLEETNAADGPPGLSTGFTAYDRVMGGLQPTDLIIMAGRPSMGKTALLLNIARNLGHCQESGLIFSLEMSATQLGNRLLSDVGGVDSQIFRHGKVPSNRRWQEIRDAADTVSQMPIHIEDTPGITISQVETLSRKYHLRHGIRWIGLDYLQLMGDWDTEKQSAMSNITKRLKNLAKSLNIPVMVISQLNRALELRSDKVPKLSDLRDSGSIEQDADIVLFPYRPSVYDKNISPTVAELIAAKNRNGPIGPFDLAWSEENMRFYDAPDFGGRP